MVRRLALTLVASVGCTPPNAGAPAPTPTPAPPPTAIAPTADTTTSTTGPAPPEGPPGWKPAKPWLAGPDVVRIGGRRLQTTCGRMATNATVELVNGTPERVTRIDELIATADARPQEDRFPPYCVSWLAGHGFDDLWAQLHLQGKYGVEHDGRLWHHRGGTWQSRMIKRPRLYAATWTNGRVITIVRHRGAGQELSDTYPQMPSQAAPIAHYAPEVVDGSGALADQPLDQRIRRRCADGSFGSRLVEPSALAVAPDGHVFVVGRDCLKSKTHPAFDDAPAVMATETWGPSGGSSRWIAMPSSVRDDLTLVAAAGTNVWAFGTAEPFLAHFDGTQWVDVAPPAGGVLDLVVASSGRAWLVAADGTLWRGDPARFEPVAVPEPVDALVVEPSSASDHDVVWVQATGERAWMQPFAR